MARIGEAPRTDVGRARTPENAASAPAETADQTSASLTAGVPSGTDLAGRSAHVLHSMRNAATRHGLVVSEVDRGLERAATQTTRELMKLGLNETDAAAAAYRAQQASRTALVGRGGEYTKWGVNPQSTQIAGRRAEGITKAALKTLPAEQAELAANSMRQAAEEVGQDLTKQAKAAAAQELKVSARSGVGLFGAAARWALPSVGLAFAANDTVRAGELAFDTQATFTQKTAGAIAATGSLVSVWAVAKLIGEGAALVTAPGWLPWLAAGGVAVAFVAIAFRDNPKVTSALRSLADQVLSVLPGTTGKNKT